MVAIPGEIAFSLTPVLDRNTLEVARTGPAKISTRIRYVQVIGYLCRQGAHMMNARNVFRRFSVELCWLAPLVVCLLASLALKAEETPGIKGAVTFSKDIAPILQRSCQNCHQPNSVAPMALITYKDTRPWARAIKERTLLRDKAGVMPPWYVEKNIGIQHYKNDNSLSDLDLAKIAKWVDSGA